MRITKSYLRDLIKEQIKNSLDYISEDLGASLRIELLPGDLDTYDPNRKENAQLSDTEINAIQSKMQEANPQAEFIRQMDSNYDEKALNRSYENRKNLYVDQGKSHDGKKIYFKKVVFDPKGTYGVVHLA